MNCRDCMEQLDPFLDRELSEQELRQVAMHLEFCPPCESVFELRADLKRLVRVCCHEDRAPAELRERLSQILR